MTERLKKLFVQKPLLSISQMNQHLKPASLPVLEEALEQLLQQGSISVVALPGSPMSEIDPQHPEPNEKAGDVFFERNF